MEKNSALQSPHHAAVRTVVERELLELMELQKDPGNKARLYRGAAYRDAALGALAGLVLGALVMSLQVLPAHVYGTDAWYLALIFAFAGAAHGVVFFGFRFAMWGIPGTGLR